MRPLVAAVVADETGTMKATFFNQPRLARNYRPATRLLRRESTHSEHKQCYR